MRDGQGVEPILKAEAVNLVKRPAELPRQLDAQGAVVIAPTQGFAEGSGHEDSLPQFPADASAMAARSAA